MLKIPPLLIAGALTLSLPLGATEDGATAFPNGGEDFMVADMPPPGVFGWLTFNTYSADRLANGAGHMPLAGFDLTVSALVPRLDWVKPASILGADRWGTLFVAPLLDLDLVLSPAPGVSVKGHRRAMGDLTIGNGLHWTFPRFNMINSVDVVFPTGAYDAMALVNPGQNKWVIRLNHLGTWHPKPAWDLSYRLHWDFNFKNRATGYSSGQTIYLNWALGWQPTPPLTVGLAGYFLRQITDDRLAGLGVAPDGNRTRVNGIGPAIRYFLPNHVMLGAKYFREFGARNHADGEQFWCYVVVPLSRPKALARIQPPAGSIR